MRAVADRIRHAVRPKASPATESLSFGQKLLTFVGSLAYVGYLPASGTVSVALVGVPAYLLLSGLHPSTFVAVVGVFTLVAVAVHHYGDRVLGEKDSNRLVWDELAGYWIAMIGLPVSWPLVALGFVLERGLDILKPWPASLIERRLPGGWGVVLDDVIAGVYACLLLHVLLWISPEWLAANMVPSQPAAQ